MDSKRLLLCSVKTFDTILTVAFYVYESITKNLEEDDILYYLFISSVILRAILNSITLKNEVKSDLTKFCLVQTLQLIPIGLLTGGIVRGFLSEK